MHYFITTNLLQAYYKNIFIVLYAQIVTEHLDKNMRLLVTILFLAAALQYSQGQDKETALSEELDETIKLTKLGDAGFILRSALNKKQITRRYTPQGDLSWEVKGEPYRFGKSVMTIGARMDNYDYSTNFIVSTPSGSWIYDVDMNPDNLYKKEHFITRINKNGEAKKFTIEGREELGKALQSVFCDEQYFYLLATDNGDEMTKRLTEEKLILNRYDVNSFAYKRIVLDLPKLADDRANSFWSFIGQSATEKFLVSKDIDSDANTCVFTMAAFNADGKVTRTWKIDVALENAFFRPANNVKYTTAFHSVANLDYTINRSGSSGQYFPLVPLTSAYSDVVFNEVTETFYVYGLFGPAKMRRMASEYMGYYIFQYDIKGALKSKLQHPASKQLLDESYFRIHAMPGYRDISLNVLPDRTLNFTIHFKDIIYTIVIDKDRNTVRTIRREDHDMLGENLFWSLAPSKADSYLEKVGAMDTKKKNRLSYAEFVSSEGEALLEITRDNAYKILYFKK